MYYPQALYRQWNGNNTNYEMKVTGEGKVSIQPDRAEIRLGVETEDKELKKAQTENAKTINKVTQALMDLGIPNEMIRTVDYSIFPIYDYIDGKQTFRGYKVNHVLNVTIDDINQVGLVVDTAVNNGVNNVSRIDFSISDKSSVYQQALALAVQDSIRKAKTIANSLNVKIQQIPILIVENPQTVDRPIPFQETPFVKSATTDTQIEPGTLDITAFVRSTFKYSY